MGLAYIILFISCVVALTNGKHFRSDYKYGHVAIHGWFKMHAIPATWFDAYLQCYNEGAVLASPENLYFLDMMMQMMNETNTTSSVFTGIHATYSSGYYHTVEGTPFSEIEKYITWAPNEPANHNDNEEVLMMSPDGTVASVPTTYFLPFICFKRKTHLQATECGTTDPDYTLDERTGSCYKIHRRAQKWSRAFATCSGEGGYLVIINSEIEAQVIRELFENVTGMHGYAPRSLAFVGFRDFHGQGYFITVHGQSLTGAGYNTWDGSHGSEPEANTLYQCGSVNRKATFTMANCEFKMNFICEKDPDSLMSGDEEISLKWTNL